MRRLLFLTLVFVVSLSAANFKLYLKDGDFQLVREYKVEGDKVSYYSVERSDWEEMPAALIDLKRTEAESAVRKQTLDKQAKDISEEDEAARQARAEIRKIPQDPGVYSLENGELRIFKEAEASIHNEKGMNTLKRLSPLPVFAGKSTLEIAGKYSQEVVKEDRPEFYLQLAAFESFGIVKLTTLKENRVVEKISIVPVSKEYAEDRTKVEIFQKELAENGLYKIWPQEPLEKGEYAVIEYTEGKINHRVWDFRIQ